MIVAAAEGQLLVAGGADTGADGLGRGEIEGRAGHGGQDARGDEALVHGGVAAGIDGQQVAVDVAVAGPTQVEVGVVGEVHGRGRIRGGDIAHAQGVAAHGGVGHRHVEVAGVALFTGGAAVAQFQGGAVRRDQGLGLPQHLVEADVATVEVAGHAVGLVVGGQGGGDAIDGEAALGDAVAVAADEAAEVGRARAVGLQVVEAEDHVPGLARAVGNLQGHDRATVVADAHRHARVRAQGVELGLPAIGHGAPGLGRGLLDGGQGGQGAGQGGNGADHGAS